MATDVVAKAIEANDIHNGTLTQSTQVNGVSMDTDTTYTQTNPDTIADVEARLTDRADDIRYYTS